MFFEGFYGRMSASVNDEGVLITVNVPGYGKEDLTIRASNGAINVSSKNPAKKTHHGQFTIGNNRKFRYTYSTPSLDDGFNIPIGEKFDLSMASATVDKGVLTIRVPFFEEKKSGEIEIQIT